ncbi:MAG: hypothetical protein WEB90_03365, partial [Gemmatimonadota bacterium]
MRALVDAAEERLQPLTLARNVAWWDINVEASGENERRRAETELAYSDALADRELYRDVEAARSSNGDSAVSRRLELLQRLMLPHQVTDSLRSRIVELEAAVEGRFSRHRAVIGGEEVEDNEIKRIL